jgi:hypothetical protein
MWGSVGRGRRTDCAVQANGTENISGAALGVREKPSRAESSTASGSEGSGSGAGGESEDGVTHLEGLGAGSRTGRGRRLDGSESRLLEMLLDADDGRQQEDTQTSLYLSQPRCFRRQVGGLLTSQLSCQAMEFLRPLFRVFDCGCSRPWFIEHEPDVPRMRHDAVGPYDLHCRLVACEKLLQSNQEALRVDQCPLTKNPCCL